MTVTTGQGKTRRHTEGRDVSVNAQSLRHDPPPRASVSRSRPPLDAPRDGGLRFRSLCDHSVDAIFIATGEGTILVANQAWLEMFQYSRDELASLNAGDVYAHPVDRHELMRRVAESAHFRDEVSYRRKDGTVFSAHLAAVALRDQAGAVRSYESIIYDVTSE